MLSADLPQSGPVCQGSFDSYLRICLVFGTVIGQVAIPVRCTRCRSDNSGTVLNVWVHLATMPLGVNMPLLIISRKSAITLISESYYIPLQYFTSQISTLGDTATYTKQAAANREKRV